MKDSSLNALTLPDSRAQFINTSTTMPYACATFDQATNAAMREATDRFAAASAFVPQDLPFHVPLFGSLHTYEREAVHAALATGPTALVGRFVKWEIKATKLRAVVEFIPHELAALQQLLLAALPRGKPWASLYAELGSVAGLDAASHAAFLSAVEAAFPMDITATFTSGGLEFREDRDEPEKKKTTKAFSKLNPKAAPFAPAVQPPLMMIATSTATKKTRPKKNKMKQQHASPHMKWERRGATDKKDKDRDGTGTSSSIDALIKGGSRSSTTGGTGPRIVQVIKKKSAAERAAAVAKARGSQVQA